MTKLRDMTDERLLEIASDFDGCLVLWGMATAELMRRGYKDIGRNTWRKEG